METKCWVSPLQLHRPLSHMGKPSRIFFFNILVKEWKMGFCTNKQQYNCTGSFTFLALRKIHLPYFVKDSCIFFYIFLPRCDLTCATPQLVVGRHLGSFCFHKVLLSTNNVELDSWDLVIQCEHHKNGFAKGWPPSSLWGRQDGFSWALLSWEPCWVWQFTVTECSLVTVGVQLGREFYLSHGELQKKLHHVTILYVTLHAENVPQRQAKLFTLISSLTQKPC